VDDPLHVQLQRIPLGNDKQRFINTLILDQNTVHGSASERTNIILCHGFGAGLGFLYKNVWPLSRLVPNCRVYAIDLLGMGRSGRPEFPKFQINNTQGDATLAVDFFLNSFEEWRVKQDGLEKFVLVGHSMGGYLSALYALRHPQKVRKLILASPVGLPEQVGDGVAVTGHKIPSWISHLWNANYTPQGMLRGMGPLGPRFAHGYINNRFPYLPEPERISLATYFYHISADSGSGEYALAALLAPGAWAREPLHSRLPKLAMPTTFMYGENDWMDKRHAAAAAEKMTVEVDIISVSQAGHHLNLDNPQEFNRIVADQVINI
jgi:cardiolipin-specific phospholipase